MVGKLAFGFAEFGIVWPRGRGLAPAPAGNPPILSDIEYRVREPVGIIRELNGERRTVFAPNGSPRGAMVTGKTVHESVEGVLSVFGAEGRS